MNLNNRKMTNHPSSKGNAPGTFIPNIKCYIFDKSSEDISSGIRFKSVQPANDETIYNLFA